MAVMYIWIVRMGVDNRFVPMHVCMSRLGRHRLGMSMLVVRIVVRVFMLVFYRFVRVLMLMPLGKVQP